MNNFEIIDTKTTVTCRICGAQIKRIYGKHLTLSHDNLSSVEYKKMFPDAPLASLSDKVKTSKNSGLHMKNEKYKKMFSEKFKGENNPMHKSKTTENYRKENSPFSIEFYKKRFPNLEISDWRKMLTENAKKFLKDRLSNTKIEYYLNKGYDEIESKRLLSERQATFTLKICREKYGEEDGLKKWKDRQEKWQLNYKKSNFSKISQLLFKTIYECIKHSNDEIYFATLNKEKEFDDTGKNYEYRLILKDRLILPDFFVKNLKKIIEFDGTYYHRENTENKKREIDRNKSIIESGYEVLHISEFEYKKNASETVKKCLDFINYK